LSAAAALTLVPARHSLVEYIGDVEAIISTLDTLDDLADTDSIDELSRMLVDAISGTKAKIDSSCRVLASFDSAEAAAKAERDRLDARAKYFARQRERLEAYLLRALSLAGVPKMDGNTSSIAVRLNPASTVPDATVAGPLAPEFVRPPKPSPWEPDKTAIKGAIAAGREVPGWSTSRAAKLVRS
jgi:hypothetical protein